MKFPARIARISRHLPVWRVWPFGVVEHVGRCSVRLYRTPVTAFATEDGGWAILLSYGTDVDWLANLRAWDGGLLRRFGRNFIVVDPRVVDRAEAAKHVKARWIFERLPFDHAVLLRRVT